MTIGGIAVGVAGSLIVSFLARLVDISAQMMVRIRARSRPRPASDNQSDEG